MCPCVVGRTQAAWILTLISFPLPPPPVPCLWNGNNVVCLLRLLEGLFTNRSQSKGLPPVRFPQRQSAGWAVVLSGKRQLLSCSAGLDCGNAGPVFSDLVICRAEVWNTVTAMFSFKTVTSEVIFPEHVLNYVC